MLNIGPQELLLILVLALVVVGPRRLPELGRSLGKGLRELRKAQDEVRKTIQVNLDEETPAERSRRRPRRLPVEASVAASEETAPDGDEPTGPERASEPASGADVAAPAAAASAEGGVSEISRSLGRSLAELRRAREEIQRSFRVDLDPAATAPRGASAPSTPSGSTGTAAVDQDAAPGPEDPGTDGADDVERPG